MRDKPGGKSNVVKFPLARALLSRALQDPEFREQLLAVLQDYEEEEHPTPDR